VGGLTCCLRLDGRPEDQLIGQRYLNQGDSGTNCDADEFMDDEYHDQRFARVRHFEPVADPTEDQQRHGEQPEGQPESAHDELSRSTEGTEDASILQDNEWPSEGNNGSHNQSGTSKMADVAITAADRTTSAPMSRA
jgi:hypothetical protein